MDGTCCRGGRASSLGRAGRAARAGGRAERAAEQMQPPLPVPVGWGQQCGDSGVDHILELRAAPQLGLHVCAREALEQ